MKKIILLLTIFYLIFTENASAVVISTPSPSVTDNLNEQINALKSRITSKVAELKLVEKRGIIGKVTDVSGNQITISNISGNTVFIDVDELTKFSSPQAKGAFGISDITKDMQIGILGLYNKESRRVLARFINVLNMPLFMHGTISSIDNKNFSFDVVLENGKLTTVDVQATTKTFSYTKSTTYARSGFSKIKENESVVVVGTQDEKNPELISAKTIILLPEITLQNAKTTLSEVTVPPTSLSTESGNKVTPITR